MEACLIFPSILQGYLDRLSMNIYGKAFQEKYPSAVRSFPCVCPELCLPLGSSVILYYILSCNLQTSQPVDSSVSPPIPLPGHYILTAVPSTDVNQTTDFCWVGMSTHWLKFNQSLLNQQHFDQYMARFRNLYADSSLIVSNCYFFVVPYALQGAESLVQ